MPLRTSFLAYSGRLFYHLLRGLTLLILISLYAWPSMAQGEKDLYRLEQGKAVERELSGTNSHSYLLRLETGHLLDIVVEQRGVDVVVVLFSPDGKKLVEVDSPNGTQGPEPLTWIAEKAGAYKLEVRSLEKNAPVGRYSVTINELRKATAEDRNRFSTERLIAGAIPLETGKTQSGKITYGETLNYRVTLNSGGLLHLVINPGDVGLVITIFDSINNKLTEVSHDGDRKRVTPIILVAESDGTYRVEVRPARSGPSAGSYSLQLESNTKKSLEESIKKYTEMLPPLQGSTDKSAEARLLNNIGNLYAALNDFGKALDYYNRALPLYRVLGNRREEALTLYYIGRNYQRSDEYRKGIEFYSQAAQIRRELGDRSGEANLLRRIGSCYAGLFENSKSVEYFQRALEIKRVVGDRPEQAMILQFMAQGYVNSTQFSKAVDAFNQELALRRILRQRGAEASALNNIGMAYGSMGEMQKALDYYNETLRVARTVRDKYSEATALTNMATFYGYTLGDYQKALELYNQALELIRAGGGDPWGESRILAMIAEAYRSAREYQKAIDTLNVSLSIAEKNRDILSQANALLGIAQTNSMMGKHKEAIEYLNRILSMARDAINEYGLHPVWRDLGYNYYLLGDYPKALEHLNHALRLYRLSNAPEGEAVILFLMARTNRELGKLAEARPQIEDAIKIIENLRNKLASQEQRAAFLATNQSYYEFYIELLMRLHSQRPSDGFDALAIQASERARARSLLDLLTEAKADIRQGIAPELIRRERDVQQKLNATAQRQMQILAANPKSEQATAMAKELETLTAQFQQIQAQIRQSSPRYAALTQPQPLSLKEIQAEVLDEETLLLEYSLGEENSYLWAVTKKSIKSYVLPKREEIDAAARRVYDRLNARNLIVPNETVDQRRTRVARSDAEYMAAALALSQIALTPVAPQLKDKRLVIVSDGALQYIPFAALPEPTDPAAQAQPTPLIVNHEIVSLPSASTLAVLRREVRGRRAALKTVAVLADPVFQSDDARVRAGMARAAETNRRRQAAQRDIPVELERSAVESSSRAGELLIPRLPGTRQEALQILSLAPPAKRKRAFDFRADRATATSSELAQYRYIHFATHGFLNSQHPELSGIVLSLVNETGKPQDGFLRLNEVFNLKLSADMVVLSACQTGMGKEVRGEGLIGLTRGFMYAGAPRVVVSLWSVSDAATAELMTRFYRGVLMEKMRPAKALQAAQVSMLNDKRFASPFYWAAFIQQGEWQ